MPLYEYLCENCKAKEEKFLPVERRNEVQECPECKGLMKLQISKTNFKFHDPTELEAQYGRGGINDYE